MSICGSLAVAAVACPGRWPAPRGAELQVLDQQHRDQCCPNLDAQRVGTGGRSRTWWRSCDGICSAIATCGSGSTTPSKRLRSRPGSVRSLLGSWTAGHRDRRRSLQGGLDFTEDAISASEAGQNPSKTTLPACLGQQWARRQPCTCPVAAPGVEPTNSLAEQALCSADGAFVRQLGPFGGRLESPGRS